MEAAKIQEAQAQTLEENGALHGAVNELKQNQLDISNRIEKLEQENAALKQRLIAQEAYSRRHNLRVHGIKETPNEDPEELVLNLLHERNFPYFPRAIERAHRIGAKVEGKIRPILVRFNHYKDRECVWRVLGHGTNPPPAYNYVHVREDFAVEMEEERSKLFTIARAAQKVNVPGSQAPPKIKLNNNKLYINDQKVTASSMHQLPENLQPRNIYIGGRKL